MLRQRILLVEDELHIQETLAIALHGEGYVVDTAATVVQAMTLLDRHHYALAIADWRLPDGDGLLIAETAKELGAETFVMSGYLFHMPGGRVEQHETLMKPLRPSEIIAAVEQKIGKAI